MKRKTFVSILILVLAVLFFSQCATTSKNVISKSEPLSNDKAYFAGVFYYACAWSGYGDSYDPYSPELRLVGDNKKNVYMHFTSGHTGGKNPSRPDVLIIVEVEPGEYTAKSITKMEGYFPRKIMGIPPELRDKITAESGSVTYLGDFSIVRHYKGFSSVKYVSEYVYDFEKFQSKIDGEYIIPENFKLKKL